MDIYKYNKLEELSAVVNEALDSKTDGAENSQTRVLWSVFGGDFGGALMESFDLESTSPEELVEIAERKDIDLRKHEI